MFDLAFPAGFEPTHTAPERIPEQRSCLGICHHAEDGRVAVRNVRRDARKHLEAAEKESKISANEVHRAERELEKITHDHIEEIDRALAKKEHELLEV